jgi:hypothetical protein
MISYPELATVLVTTYHDSQLRLGGSAPRPPKLNRSDQLLQLASSFDEQFRIMLMDYYCLHLLGDSKKVVKGMVLRMSHDRSSFQSWLLRNSPEQNAVKYVYAKRDGVLLRWCMQHLQTHSYSVGGPFRPAPFLAGGGWTDART